GSSQAVPRSQRSERSTYPCPDRWRSQPLTGNTPPRPPRSQFARGTSGSASDQARSRSPVEPTRTAAVCAAWACALEPSVTAPGRVGIARDMAGMSAQCGVEAGAQVGEPFGGFVSEDQAQVPAPAGPPAIHRGGGDLGPSEQPPGYFPGVRPMLWVSMSSDQPPCGRAHGYPA